MAEADGSEEHANNVLAPPSVTVVPPDIIDLTDSDEYSPISSENCDAQTFSITSITPPAVVDDSMTVVNENIKPGPEMERIDPAKTTIGEVHFGSSGYSSDQISGKVRIGSRSIDYYVALRNGKDKVFDAQGTVKMKCGICKDPAEEINGSNRTLLATVCGHIFCSVCFKESTKRSKLCPRCRKKLTKKQVHNLYV